jgi:hypothetical protein
VSLLYCFSLVQVPGLAQTPPNLRRSNPPQPLVSPAQQKGKADDLGRPLEVSAEAAGIKYTQNRSQSPNLEPQAPQSLNTLELDPFSPKRNNGVNLIRIDTP